MRKNKRTALFALLLFVTAIIVSVPANIARAASSAAPSEPEWGWLLPIINTFLFASTGTIALAMLRAHLTVQSGQLDDALTEIRELTRQVGAHETRICTIERVCELQHGAQHERGDHGRR